MYQSGNARWPLIPDGKLRYIAISLYNAAPPPGYRDAGQCSALQGGGEGPRGRAARPERALAVRLVDSLRHGYGHDRGDTPAVTGDVGDAAVDGGVVQHFRQVLP